MGRANDTVSAMLTLPGSLDTVIATLRRHFGRPDFVVQIMIDKAMTFGNLKQGDMLGFVDFSNAVSNLVAIMQLLKSDGHIYNPQFR